MPLSINDPPFMLPLLLIEPIVPPWSTEIATLPLIPVPAFTIPSVSTVILFTDAPVL